MSGRATFYAQRDRRTAEYGVPDTPGILDASVGVAIGADAAATLSGQLCALALVNMLARLHRSLRIVVADVPLLVPAESQARSLGEACLDIVVRVDPFNDVEARHDDPNGFLPEGRSIGLGCSAPPTTLCVGANGFLGEISAEGVSFSDHGCYYIGSGIAACLAAAAAIRLVAGQRVIARRISFWDFAAGAGASMGPDIPAGPVDVGRVWMVGAGAVGSAVAYWLSFPRVRGSWTVIDKDRVELHNTNRSLCLFPADAGWPCGQRADKAPLVAARIGADHVVDEYGHWASGYRGRLPDLVLPLANDSGVRSAISNLGQPILIHAATGGNWESHLHRHIAGVDDCIDCRLPELGAGRLKCSSGTLPATALGANSDAALPFLSAAAGLMVVAAMVQIEHGADSGEYLGLFNRRSLLLDLTQARSWQEGLCGCVEGCRGVPSSEMRGALHADSKWGFLDPAHA